LTLPPVTNIPYIPESAPFTPEQRAWLNGFLAGLFANGVAPQASPPPPASQPAETLLILFGSQTGTAEALARRFAVQARQRGFAPQVLPLNDFQQSNLTAGGKAIIVSSTWGDGDPPDNAANFWSWLNADSAPRLESLHFGVLGLGDRNYPDFCGASRKFDGRLAELGAKRLVSRGECDAEYETAANAWIETLWNQLAGKPLSASAQANPSTNGSVNGFHGSSNGSNFEHDPAAKPLYDRHNPFPARLLTNLLLNKPGSAKEVRHFELDLHGSELSYQAGDSLGVNPANCPDLVKQIIAALRSNADEIVTVEGSALSLREALTRHLEITRPSQELVAAVAKAAPDTELARLLAADKPDALKTWLYGRGVIDLIQLLQQPFALPEFIGLLKKLAPRLYSISSSPKAHPGQVHLTVSAVRYQSHGLLRKGVASTFLADRIGGADFVKLFVQHSNNFRPPPSGDTPMIMVGPGTGVAPFRAFLQDRQVAGATGKNWLFFGDQTRAGDFLYESQLTSWEKDGLLARLDLAFSRDQAEKLYVQHRMLENAKALWAWLDNGAHFYVCGDASRMARDVDDALHKIIETAAGKTHDQAKDFIAKLKTEKRYQRDVY
jgi:sulfite reductase (NADPH) flavoprotein alpha-component